ncbi:adrenocorticotropic hormone receptor-like [Saccostrea echinata]|uniref:adrenocorticotropic hormone receptor-like n=1 Tax=Saccostrea echinata TaxID=191078 RepID=UPI002A7EB9AA|nr:adrenocorticotropic hormone receptor-like [Saccostrea echinata]
MIHFDIFGNLSDLLKENNTSPYISVPHYMVMPFGMVIVMENVISICLLYACTRLCFQIRIMSLNLAISDFLMGISICIPNTLLNEKYHCDIKKYPGFLFITVSLFIITTMNVDRCCVFALAMRYYSFITKKLIINISVALWVMGLLVTFGTFFDLKDKYGLSCIVMTDVKRNAVTLTCRSILLIILTFNLIMFIYFMYQVRKRLGRISDTSDRAQSTTFAREQARISGKTSLIIGVFLIAFFPFMITCSFPFDPDSETFRKTFSIVVMIMLFNSACNPIFYVWRFSEPRYHLKRILCFWNKKQRLEIENKYNQENASYTIDLKK